MKKILTLVLFVALLFAIVYVLFSIYVGNWEIMNWDFEMRKNYVIIMGILMVLLFFASEI